MQQQDGTLLRAIEVMQKLLDQGHQAYMVGGAVRDWLLGKKAHDVDIATDATPQQVLSCFPRAIPTGLKHGTVTVWHEGEPFEVTTFRVEKDYQHHRWPEVSFTADLTSDLARRDFTINAMALDVEGNIIDPFGGREDLKKGQIRAVGDPDERFVEDALRMLRAVRFAAQLGFEIQADTWEALTRQAPLLGHISMERIRQELTGILEAPHAPEGLMMLQHSGLRQQISPMRSFLPWKREQLQRLEPLSALRQRWAALLLLSHAEPQLPLFQQLLRQLTYPKKLIRQTLRLVQHAILLEAKKEQPSDWPEMLLNHPWPEWEESLQVHQCWKALAPEEAAGLRRSLSEAYARMPIHHQHELAIKGSDLIHHLREPAGPWVARMLQEMTVLVARNRLSNHPQSLLEWAQVRWKNRC